MYKFSPIKNKEEMYKAIKHIHISSYKLCKDAIGEHLPNSGNIGIFCHYPEEYNELTKLREEMTESSDNVDQKYFRLREPITIEALGDIPETTYTYLYVRKPDPYRHHVGDIDFYLNEAEYGQLKVNIKNGADIPGARIFPSPRLDMVELYNPDVDVLAYVSTEKMTQVAQTTLSQS